MWITGTYSYNIFARAFIWSPIFFRYLFFGCNWTDIPYLYWIWKTLLLMIRHGGRGVWGVVGGGTRTAACESLQIQGSKLSTSAFFFFSSQANGEAARGVEVNCSTFDSKPEGLQKPCRLVEGCSLSTGRCRGRGSRVEMLKIRVYGWPEGVSIIHKVRPPNMAWRRIDLAKKAGWQSDHFISLLRQQITC